jgi:hypothetical protein
MRLRRSVGRLTIVLFTVAVVASALYYGRQAVASVSPGRPAIFVASDMDWRAPEFRSQTTGDAPDPQIDESRELVRFGAIAEEGSCPTSEEVYLAIAEATQGADIAAISAALAEVQADPSGATSIDASPLAQRLRVSLGLNNSTPVCETILLALQDAVQLAQIASAAAASGVPQTGSVGAPGQLSPSYSTVPPGTAGGARGHGYCTQISTGCLG